MLPPLVLTLMGHTYRGGVGGCTVQDEVAQEAGGKTGIMPELVVFGGGILWDRLLEMMQDAWREGEVMTDWKNAEVLPIPT